MWAGLARAIAGGRLTDISAAVEQTITAERTRTASSTTTAGTASAPRCTRTRTCSTTAVPAAAPKLVPGLALAIEPMVTVGDPATVELEDGWTVVTKDGSRAAHFEHTVAITPEGPWVLTAEDGGVAGLAPFGITPALAGLCGPGRTGRAPFPSGGRVGDPGAPGYSGRWRSRRPVVVLWPHDPGRPRESVCTTCSATTECVRRVVPPWAQRGHHHRVRERV